MLGTWAHAHVVVYSIGRMDMVMLVMAGMYGGQVDVPSFSTVPLLLARVAFDPGCIIQFWIDLFMLMVLLA